METVLLNKTKDGNNSLRSKTNSETQTWKERLTSLEEEKQKHIAEKYYGGKMPWKK